MGLGRIASVLLTDGQETISIPAIEGVVMACWKEAEAERLTDRTAPTYPHTVSPRKLIPLAYIP